MAGNGALTANPPSGSSQHITTHGSDWLWACFSVMLFADIVVLVWHFMIPRGQRVFHQLSLIILTTASIAYFTMASDLGFANIATEFGSEGFPAGVYRQIWYTRYIDWVVTTPALLLTLVLASGLPLSDIITLAFFDLVMIITGLIGALVESTYKWGFYAFGCVALFYIWWVLAGPARSSSAALGKEFQKAFTGSAIILSFLWLLYPIAWGLADGGNVISPDSEMVFYGILDVLAKPVFCFFHLFMLSRCDLSALHLTSGKYSSSANGSSNGYDAEKHGRRGHLHSHSHSAAVDTTGPTSFPKAKKPFYSRKGKYDDVTTGAAATSVGTGTGDHTGIAGTTRGEEQLGSPAATQAEPRLSQATAVSH